MYTDEIEIPNLETIIAVETETPLLTWSSTIPFSIKSGDVVFHFQTDGITFSLGATNLLISRLKALILGTS